MKMPHIRLSAIGISRLRTVGDSVLVVDGIVLLRKPGVKLEVRAFAAQLDEL
jgi:hypothetical protein